MNVKNLGIIKRESLVNACLQGFFLKKGLSCGKIQEMEKLPKLSVGSRTKKIVQLKVKMN